MPNGILIVDKPSGWTSHDVVAKLRGLLGERRVGHCGTLDPMATGVLPVFAGRATRAVSFAAEGEKEYIAWMKLGIVTDTQDSTGTILEENPVSATEEDVEASLQPFRNEIFQIPPMYSARKQNGRRLYTLARSGQIVEREPRRVVVSRLVLLDSPGDHTYRLHVVCSKGTYIRTLCHDIGRSLGCGAVMSGLRRTRVGQFTESQALSIERIAEAAARGEAQSLLLPIDTCFLQYPSFSVAGEQERRCRNGTPFPAEGEAGLYRVYDEQNSFLMLGRLRPDGYMETVKSFY